MKTTTRQSDMFQVSAYERVALILRAVAAYLHSPLTDRKNELAVHLREYQDCWIKARSPDHDGEVSMDSIGPQLVREIMRLSDAALDGSLLEPDTITEDV